MQIRLPGMEGLEGLYPGALYTPWAREFFQPGEPEYPCHDRTIKVTRCGRICIGRRKINLSTVFAGQYVGVREVADEDWLVNMILAIFDRELNKVEPAEKNPFAPKVLPMLPE